jgi:hypothetical protein
MIGMRMTVETQRLLQDGGAPEYMYHNKQAWCCEVFVGKRYGSKEYPQGNAAHNGEQRQSCQAVHNWVQKFSEGQRSIEDEHRVSRPVQIAMPAKNFMLHVSRDL